MPTYVPMFRAVSHHTAGGDAGVSTELNLKGGSGRVIRPYKYLINLTPNHTTYQHIHVTTTTTLGRSALPSQLPRNYSTTTRVHHNKGDTHPVSIGRHDSRTLPLSPMLLAASTTTLGTKLHTISFFVRHAQKRRRDSRGAHFTVPTSWVRYARASDRGISPPPA